MFKKVLVSCLCFIFILELLYTNISYAEWVEVTQENLTKALQEFVISESNDEGYQIEIEQNIINIAVDNENYNIKYDLTDKPIFILEIPIEKGMSYEEFEKKTDKLHLPMLGYIAVANIQGVEFKDAKTYFWFSYLENLNGSYSNDGTYWIVDDLNMSNGVTVEKNDDPKTIYTSEFGDRVMEYVNYLYGDVQTATDSNEIDSYTMTIERQETTDTSCKLVSTLSINPEADFTKLNGYVDNMEDSFMNSDITKENADLVLMLKVGQKCKIESSEEITGYEFGGYDCIEFNEDRTEITATNVGTTNGYLYVGNEKKSIYITVEENTGDTKLDTIKLKIDSAFNDNPFDTPKDDTHAKTEISNAGSTNRIYIMGIMVIVNLILYLKNKKYENLK